MFSAFVCFVLLAQCTLYSRAARSSRQQPASVPPPVHACLHVWCVLLTRAVSSHNSRANRTNCVFTTQTPRRCCAGIDARCVKLLTNLRAAMPPGSILVNFDRLCPDYGTQGFHPAKAMDINMLVSDGWGGGVRWHRQATEQCRCVDKVVQPHGMCRVQAVVVTCV